MFPTTTYAPGKAFCARDAENALREMFPRGFTACGALRRKPPPRANFRRRLRPRHRPIPLQAKPRAWLPRGSWPTPSPEKTRIRPATSLREKLPPPTCGGQSVGLGWRPARRREELEPWPPLQAFRIPAAGALGMALLVECLPDAGPRSLPNSARNCASAILNRGGAGTERIDLGACRARGARGEAEAKGEDHMKTRRLLRHRPFSPPAGCDRAEERTHAAGLTRGRRKYVRRGRTVRRDRSWRLDVQSGGKQRWRAGAPLFALEAENESAARRRRRGTAWETAQGAAGKNLQKGRRPHRNRTPCAGPQPRAGGRAARPPSRPQKPGGARTTFLAKGFAHPAKNRGKRARAVGFANRGPGREASRRRVSRTAAACPPRPDEDPAPRRAQASAGKGGARPGPTGGSGSGRPSRTVSGRGDRHPLSCAAKWVGAGQPVVTPPAAGRT